MRLSTIVTLSLLPVLASAVEPEPLYFAEVLAFGASYHSNRAADWNELNPGAGIGLGTCMTGGPTTSGWDLRISAGVYQDSFDQQATFVMPGFAYNLGARNSLHGTLGLNVGYLDGSGSHGSGIMPVLGVAWDRWELCATGYPKAWSMENTEDGVVYPRTGLLAVFLRIRALEW